MKILLKAIEALRHRIKPQPGVDGYIQVANLIRNQMGLHPINPHTRKVTETGEPITIESFGPSLDAWEAVLPGAKARFRKMAENERCLRSMRTRRYTA